MSSKFIIDLTELQNARPQMDDLYKEGINKGIDIAVDFIKKQAKIHNSSTNPIEESHEEVNIDSPIYDYSEGCKLYMTMLRDASKINHVYG